MMGADPVQLVSAVRPEPAATCKYFPGEAIDYSKATQTMYRWPVSRRGVVAVVD